MKPWKPMLAALACFVIWGFSFLASKVGQMAASPLVILMYRFDIAFAAMAAIGLARGWKRKKGQDFRRTQDFPLAPEKPLGCSMLRGRDLRPLIVLGLCEPVIYFLGEQYGLMYTNSAFTGVMIAVIPIVTLLLTAIFLKERPTRPQWLFCLISIAGVAAITLMAGGSGQIRPEGILLLVMAVVAGSVYSVISRGISGEFSAFERSFAMQLMGAVFFTLLALIENRGDLSKLTAPLASPDFVFAALYLSLGASLTGYLLFNYAVSHAPMAKIVSLSNLTTVLSVLAGVVLLGEPFSPGSAVALLVILAGIWGVQRTGPAAPA